MAGIIKEALEFILDINGPKIVNNGDWSYSTDPNLERLDECLSQCTEYVYSVWNGRLHQIQYRYDG